MKRKTEIKYKIDAKLLQIVLEPRRMLEEKQYLETTSLHPGLLQDETKWNEVTPFRK